MPLDFPNNPTLNQQYQNWIWNGTAWVVTAAQPVPYYNNVGRNLFHNGLFNIQQRGQGPWTASGYTADRWLTQYTGGDTLSTSIVALADSDRAQIGDEAAQYAWQHVVTGSSTSGSYSLAAQLIENVRRTSGKTVTLSFWARATSGTPKIGIEYYQLFGTGGSPSPAVANNLGVTPNLSSTWQRYSFTVAIPSAAGKTFGTTAGTDRMNIDFWLSDQGTYAARSGGIGVQSGTIQFWGMQLEYGSVATPVEKVDPRFDLTNCQRFYQVWSAVQIWGSTFTGGNATTMCMVLSPPMRASPSITLGTITGSSACTGASFGAASSSIIQTFGTGTTANSTFWVTYSAVAMSADL